MKYFSYSNMSAITFDRVSNYFEIDDIYDFQSFLFLSLMQFCLSIKDKMDKFTFIIE